MEIRAPLSGVVVPLADVPDPVFAGGLAGEGVAIDPTSNEVVAPVAGRVTGLHRARHAVTVTAANGIELLVHVGLDTVRLDGRGFTPLVEVGAEVACGQPLLRFDADVVACSARSLITVVLATNPERIAKLTASAGMAEAGRSVLLRIETRDAAPEATPAQGETFASKPIVLPNPSGLHARPSAVLAEAARRFASDLRIVRGVDVANVKSVIGVIGLSTRKGDTVRIEATGRDAREAVAALEALLASGSGESLHEPAPAPQPVAAARPGPRSGELVGVPASPGVAIGRIVQLRRAEIAVNEDGGTPDEEGALFRAGLDEVVAQLEALRRGEKDPARAAILGVQRTLLDDPELMDEVQANLRAGRSAAASWKRAYVAQAETLEKLQIALLRERASDVRDVGRRLLAILAGANPTGLTLPAGSILVAEELTPSETASLDPALVAGFCTTTGGPTSHVAIVARSLGIPAVCGIDDAVLALGDGTQAILDGTAGTLKAEPDDASIGLAQERLAADALRRENEKAAAFQAAHTRDGARRVEVAANIRTLDDARAAMAAGADGVGLLRSEFLFADRQQPPTIDEQADAYRSIAKVIGPRHRLVVRTLDVGGDKALPYLPIPREDNPFLGLRGIRVSLDNPELLRTQIRAILRAAGDTALHIMFPMVASLEELRAARRIVEQERGDAAVQIGIMVEVPAAAIMADVIAREVDFFSIGTNDLTQYTLAMDRGHPKLAKNADALHPAVLRMIEHTVAGAHRHDKWVGVCGGIASDPVAVPALVGLGVDELSVSVPAIASVKAAIGRYSYDESMRIAAEALACETATDVRALLAREEELRMAARATTMNGEPQERSLAS